MKKFSVIFLAALFMVAGTAYLISMTGVDKAEQQAIKEMTLSLKKAALGSPGLEITQPAEAIGRTRGEGRVRVIDQRAEQADEGMDVQYCPPCEDVSFSDVLAPGGMTQYCLACCVDQMIKVDLASDQIGVTSDLTLAITDEAGATLVADDDGRGLSGASLDPCVLFACPADGEYTIEIGNLIDPSLGIAPEASGYELTVSTLCDLEVEPNDPGMAANLNCPVIVDDEDYDDESGEMLEYMGLATNGRVQGAYGGDISDVDCFTVCLNAGDVFHVTLDSAECDDITDREQVDPVFTLEDATGNVVFVDDDTADLDSGVVYHASAMGEYTLCLADATGVMTDGLYDLIWFIEPEVTGDNANCEVIVDEDADTGDEDGD